jgi:4-amino-4-deoxy-L-arabinose transferase-like glycosyltransferase
VSGAQLTELRAPDRSARAANPRAHRPDGGGRHWFWPLAGVLAIQAVLSLRLIWSNTAFQDEALYLWVGPMEWAHWLHQAPVQQFQTWFSGSPVLYPPIAALADSLGGLMAARLLSLVLMTGVTSFLWGTARRLVGSRAAWVASAVFATLAGTEFLGAFATYDALALFLLTCAFWITVRACHRPTHGSGRDLRRLAISCLLTGALLGVSCAVKYATGVFVPLVLILSALAAERGSGRRGGVVCLVGTSTGFAVTLAAGLSLGGHPYWEGIVATTLDRPPAMSSPFTVLKLSYLWTGLIMVLAPLGFLASRGARMVERWMLAVMAAAIFLVPAEQARIETTVSLHKHVVFGAWFACMAVGYLFARLSVIDKTRGWAAVAAIPIVVFTLLKTIPQDSALYTAGWPNVTAFMTSLPRLIDEYPGDYLVGDDVYEVLGYYDQGRVGWMQWQSAPYLKVPGTPKGLASDRIAIKGHYFSIIIVPTQKTTVSSTDRALTTYIREAGGYRVVADRGGFEAWASAAGS